jgi:hypothetical protein
VGHRAMGSPLRASLAKLWASSELSDCEISFVLQQDNKQRVLGEPLPSHSFILKLLSGNFAAVLDRFAAEAKQRGAE